MADYKRPENKEDFDRNFAQKKPLMNKTEAFYESARCLFCYDAPCVQACPTHIDISLFIKQIHTNNLTGAARTIYEANWLGNACGLVCPTGVLCEGACVYNLQEVPPLQIGRLQHFATRHVIDQQIEITKTSPKNLKSVAVIGAGPAGLACACELRTLGYKVTVYEARKQASGLLAAGTAPYKITNEEVLKEVEYLQQQLDFDIKYEHEIVSADALNKLEKDYDAIFLGIGLGNTRPITIPGENLGNVTGATEFIEELRSLQHLKKIPDRVVVLGGGNTAMDAASEAARMGASEVTLVYRRSKEEMGAYAFEYDLAIGSGVKSIFNAVAVKIEGKGKVENITLTHTEEQEGELKKLEETYNLPCDMVIKATGQSKLDHLLQNVKGLPTDAKGCIKVDKNYRCGETKFFAGGDSINGGAEVVNAAYDGKKAAQGIERWLKEN